VPLELLHELRGVREEVAVRDLCDLFGGGDRWREGLAGEDGDPRDSGICDSSTDDFKAGYGEWLLADLPAVKDTVTIENIPAPVAPVTINFIIEWLEGVKANFASSS